jgi:hypothetical protein
LNVESEFRRFNIRLQIRGLRVLRGLSAFFVVLWLPSDGSRC